MMDKSVSLLSILKLLGYENLNIKSTNHYRYSINDNKIFFDYIYIPPNNFENNLYQKQSELWNENLLNFYVVFTDDKIYVFNAKQKPLENKLFNSKIDDFSYGINNAQIEELKKNISKEKIDSGYYFQIIKDKIKKIDKIDKDLLSNIIALYNNLKSISDFSFSLIFKCIFIKFLEDRNFIDNDLIDILKTNDTAKLIQKFNDVKKINGDVFKDDSDLANLNEKHIKELFLFFTSDYKKGEIYLFPYKFDIIPIELLGNVYENFVDKEIKKKTGVYYTPTFIIDFVLGFTVKEKLKYSKNIKVLDPSCGSGSFLVESYKKIIENYKKTEQIDIIKKINILKNSIFGIDIDKDSYALKIASFSLYLALFEDENPEILKNMIKENKIRLPNLINENLIKGNSLTESIFNDMKFDCIVGNPPWGSIDKKDKNYRSKINKIYKDKISDYQQSQIFLLKINDWSNEDSIIGMIVNNSNFYNLKAKKFRKNFLETYNLLYYFELLKIKIFENADYPAAILIFDKKNNPENEIKYITVYQDKLAEFLKIITYCEKDVKKIKQSDLIEEDILWRIFVNGNWEDYQLIKRKWIERDREIDIKCSAGFECYSKDEYFPENNVKLLSSYNFESFYIDYSNLKIYNYNRRLRRKPDEKIYSGNRFLYKSEPKQHRLKIDFAYTEKEIFFERNFNCLKISTIKDYKPYLAILNSSFIGYYMYNISVQWGKGKKRSILRNEDLEKLLAFPIIDFDNEEIKKITQLVTEIENQKYKKYNKDVFDNYDYDKEIIDIEKQIDYIVYNLYNLKNYEINLIEDFFLINQTRKNDIVNDEDIEDYVKKFRESFNLILESGYYLNSEYSIDQFYGAYLCFEIVDINNKKEKPQKVNSNIFEIVTENNKDEFLNWSLFKMEKKKIYDNNKLYIIKSNYLKDWTKTEAIKDAKEEIGEFFKRLPKE